MKTKLVSGAEIDAIDGKRFHVWKAGARKAIKRKIAKRGRVTARVLLRFIPDND